MADFNAQVITSTLPGCGISLKMPHYPAVLEVMDEALWFEVHTENYCGICCLYPEIVRFFEIWPQVFNNIRSVFSVQF